MTFTTALTVASPCHESWAAMTPTHTGRHCAACQKTVIDFSLKTDAEILALLARAAGETCGRFEAGQLDRVLVPAPHLPSRPWRAWVAAAAALWGLWEPMSAAAGPAVPVEHRTPHKGRPATRKSAPVALHQPLVKGVVRDSVTQRPLPGVAVFLKGANRMATTDSLGRFSLRVPARARRGRHRLVLHFTGYHSRAVRLPGAAARREPLQLALRADQAAAGVEILGYQLPYRTRDYVSGSVAAVYAAEMPPKGLAGQRARSFFRWLTSPFRRRSTPD